MTPLLVPAALLLAAPLLVAAAPLSREGAREAAQRELSKPPYHRDDPTLTERVLTAIGRWVTELVGRAASAGPGGRLGAVLLLVLLVVVVVGVRLRVGPLARREAVTAPLLGGRAGTPQEYRSTAAAAARSGNYAAGLRDRLRAVAREVEIRGVLEPRAGRTAAELAGDLAAVLPDVDARLPAAVVAFDQVWYGGRSATAGDYALAVAADEAVLAALPRTPAAMSR